MIVVIGIVAAAGVGLASFAQYSVKSQAFCTSSCHANMQMAELSHGMHKDISCGGCHDLRAGENLRQYLAGQTTSTTHAMVSSDKCRDCHAKGTKGSASKMQVGASVGHKSHEGTKDNIQCVTCHASKDHVLSPHENCAKCHESTTINEPKMAQVPCLSCHDFLSQVGGRRTSAGHDCQRCHDENAQVTRSPRFGEVQRAKDITQFQVHGTLFACSLCHNPHGKTPEEVRSGKGCVRCHGLTVHKAKDELLASESFLHQGCLSCHPAHAPKSSSGQICSTCHQGTPPGKTRAGVADRHKSCAGCHAPHTFKAEAEGCATKGCHAETVAALGKMSDTKHGACGSCHKPHVREDKSPVRHMDDTCASCHQGAKGHAHDAGCVSCHAPHGDKTATKGCVASGCHEREKQMGGAHGQDCRTCHQPHNPSAGETACASCHKGASDKTATAGVAEHTRCSSCHRGHDTSKVSAQSRCESCHSGARDAVHKGACGDCHTPHGSAKVSKEACVRCHTQVTPAHSGRHDSCGNCHKGHEKQSVALSRCATCHGPQLAATQAWKQKEHKDCRGCHADFGRGRPVACKNCHEKQYESTYSNKHQCSDCHKAHDVPTRAETSCANCHGSQVAGARQRGASHGSCKSCHTPHKDDKPTCQSCHNAAARMPGHSSKGHTKCSDCHKTHLKSEYSPASCRGCHSVRPDHHPDAKTCVACHLFK